MVKPVVCYCDLRSGRVCGYCLDSGRTEPRIPQPTPEKPQKPPSRDIKEWEGPLKKRGLFCLFGFHRFKKCVQYRPTTLWQCVCGKRSEQRGFGSLEEREDLYRQMKAEGYDRPPPSVTPPPKHGFTGYQPHPLPPKRFPPGPEVTGKVPLPPGKEWPPAPSDDPQINTAFNLDARGADPEAINRLKAELREREEQMRKDIPEIVRGSKAASNDEPAERGLRIEGKGSASRFFVDGREIKKILGADLEFMSGGPPELHLRVAAHDGIAVELPDAVVRVTDDRQLEVDLLKGEVETLKGILAARDRKESERVKYAYHQCARIILKEGDLAARTPGNTNLFGVVNRKAAAEIMELAEAVGKER